MNPRLGARPAALALLLYGPFAPDCSSAAQAPGGLSAELQRVVLGNGTMMPMLKQQALQVDPSVGAGLPSAVEIEVVVGTGGGVLHARVARSSERSGSLDGVAVEAARKLRFAPAVEPYGGPVPSLVMVRMTFDPPSSPGQAPRLSARVSEVPLVPLSARDDITALDPRDDKTPALQLPKPVRTVKPSYTADAMRALVQGAVTMEVVVLADGTVGAARVTKSLDRQLDRQALIAARYWFFEPARLDGRPVAVKATIELSFTLR